jgi:hypothetical protein
MWRIPHHKSIFKNLLVAVIVWIFQIMVMSFYFNINLDETLPKMTPQDFFLLLLPLALNIGFMVQNTPANQKG